MRPITQPIPVTVLAGYLGAGKATLLNRILTEKHGMAEEQIAFADIILLNKTDLDALDELAAVEKRFRSINAYVKLDHNQRCGIGIGEVLGRGAFDLDLILELEPEFLGEAMRPLSHERFQKWMGNLVAGSHLSVTWSLDGSTLVTSMQEKELHGWRLSDGANMWMCGYP